jgi:hypothetical protein
MIRTERPDHFAMTIAADSADARFSLPVWMPRAPSSRVFWSMPEFWPPLGGPFQSPLHHRLHHKLDMSTPRPSSA